MAVSMLRNSILKFASAPVFNYKPPRNLASVIRCSSTNKPSPGDSSLTTYKQDSKHISPDRRFDEYTRSPYKTPGPKRYGLALNYMTEGVLPRDGRPVKSMPPYRPKDSWEPKRALFGQNDYIDILGDGDVHPADLLKGPRWLLAFKGNERDRLLRKMEWEGSRLKVLYPTEYNRMQKRIRYLTKLYNYKRSRRWID